MTKTDAEREAAHERKKAYNREYARRWRQEHPERLAYKREWMARRRIERKQDKALLMSIASATLHDLSCPYPAKGCNCRVILIMPGESQ